MAPTIQYHRHSRMLQQINYHVTIDLLRESARFQRTKWAWRYCVVQAGEIFSLDVQCESINDRLGSALGSMHTSDHRRSVWYEKVVY